MTTGDATADALADLLRRLKPAQVVAVFHDGKERPLSVAQGRAARWGQLARLVVGLGAELDRLDLRDGKGATIETWRPAAEAVEALDVEAGPALAPAGAMPPEMALGVYMMRAMQTAVDHAIDRHTKSQAQSADMLVRLVEATEKRSAILERMYIESLKLTHSMFRATLEAEAQAAELANSAQADDPIAQLDRMVGMAGALGAGKPPAPTNGAPQ